MDEHCVWDKSSGWFKPQQGIQISQDSQNHLKLSCVSRGIPGKIVNAIAHLFGASTNYGVHIIPHTSSICVPETSESFQASIAAIIETFLKTDHAPIEETSANQILNSVVSEIYQSVRKRASVQNSPPFPSFKKGSLDDLSTLVKRRVAWHKSSKDDTDLPSRAELDTTPFKKWPPVSEVLIVKGEKESPLLTSKEASSDVLNRQPAKEKQYSSGLWKTAFIGSLLLLGGIGRFLIGSSPSSQPGPYDNDPIREDGRDATGNSLQESSLENDFFDTEVAPVPDARIAEMGTAIPRNNSRLEESDLENLASEIKPDQGKPPKPLSKEFAEEIARIQKAGSVVDFHVKARKKIIYNDGSFYEGDFKLPGPLPLGLGALKDKEGRIVREGKWSEGVLEDGKGTVVLDEHSLFVGPIRDGLPAGTGIRRFEGGEEPYIVEGYGTLPLENGDIFVGNIEGHRPAGYGEIRSREGGLIKEGIFHGAELVKEIKTLPFEGSTFRGEVDNQGKPDGFGVVFSEEGMFFGTFEHGTLMGERPQPKKSDMLLFTSYTENRASFNQPVIGNHEAYAEKHGYHYVKFVENLANNFEATYTQEPGQTLPYWSKNAGMLRLLNLLAPQKFPEEVRKYLPKELIWLDDDAVFTNMGIKIEDVVNHYAPPESQTHLFLTQDIMHEIGFDLNTALLFTRNSPESRLVFSEIWNRRLKKVGESAYRNCPDQSCLHEQAALQDLKKLDTYNTSKYVRVIPQRDFNDPAGGWGVNTFHRANRHFDGTRNQYLDYSVDDHTGRWKEGDFIGQATGMASKGALRDEEGRLGETQNLRELYMKQLVDAANPPLPTEEEFFTNLRKKSFNIIAYPFRELGKLVENIVNWFRG